MAGRELDGHNESPKEEHKDFGTAKPKRGGNSTILIMGRGLENGFGMAIWSRHNSKKPALLQRKY